MLSHNACLPTLQQDGGWWLCGYVQRWFVLQFCFRREIRDEASVMETIKCCFNEEFVWRRIKREKESKGERQCSHTSIKRWHSVKINGGTTVKIYRNGADQNGIRDANLCCRYWEQNWLENVEYFWLRGHQWTEYAFNFMYSVQKAHAI
jgi:cell fate regulator YaaT (PSP1 superfamily)